MANFQRKSLSTKEIETLHESNPDVRFLTDQQTGQIVEIKVKLGDKTELVVTSAGAFGYLNCFTYSPILGGN